MVEIYDLRESQEAMDTFGALIMPIAEKHGMPSASGPPAVSPVHRYWVPGA
ncbi:hypothetical protein [Streptomyces sp. NPDC058463]|uniref:hypothetical protein n=1 Tax=Streptomyces sp. NPDC058463 TaxID=3346510 RepID=UPI0036662836